MNIKQTAEKYITDVLSGEVVACKWVKLAAKRHKDNLKKQDTEQFPYHFDEARAEHVIEFVH